MSILQDLLNIGLVEIGSDDSVFEKVSFTSSALVEKFGEDPGLLVPATLITLDCDVQEEESLFSLVEALLIVEWSTLRNIHANRPRELLRSIIIDALSKFTVENAEAAGVVWNSAASRLRHRQIRLGKGGQVVSPLLTQIAQTMEREAIHQARLVGPDPKNRRRRKSTPESLSLKVDGAIKEDKIGGDVIRAIGPVDREGNSLENANPHWPNDPTNWSNEFAPRMAAAMVKATNLGTARLAKSVNEKIPDYLSGYEKHFLGQLREVETLQKEISQYYNASRIRLETLWWSESLYSPSLGVSYRELELPIAAVAAAVDIAAIVPPLAPGSVSYVLLETVLRIARILDANEKNTIHTYLECLTSANKDFGDRITDSTTTEELCVPLLSFVGQASNGNPVSLGDLRTRAGVDGSIELSAGEFSMWVFRDIQARRLVDELR